MTTMRMHLLRTRRRRRLGTQRLVGKCQETPLHRARASEPPMPRTPVVAMRVCVFLPRGTNFRHVMSVPVGSPRAIPSDG
jgi:hypothetical protein